MTFRFFIQFKTHPDEPLEARVVDEDQSDVTPWVPVPEKWVTHPYEVQLAAVCQASDEVLSMLHTAAQVAHVVFLNNEEFNLEDFMERRPTLLAEVMSHHLEQAIPEANHGNKGPRL